MLKKILLIALILFGSMSVAQADCTIGIAWTPDPAQSAITEQEVWHNPDGVIDNGDEVLKGAALASDVNNLKKHIQDQDNTKKIHVDQNSAN